MFFSQKCSYLCADWSRHMSQNRSRLQWCQLLSWTLSLKGFYRDRPERKPHLLFSFSLSLHVRDTVTFNSDNLWHTRGSFNTHNISGFFPALITQKDVFTWGCLFLFLQVIVMSHEMEQNVSVRTLMWSTGQALQISVYPDLNEGLTYG